jgi:hypothetical protein
MSRVYNTNGEKRNAYRLLVGNSEGKRPPEKSKCSWMDSIKMDLGETGLVGLYLIGLA